MNEKLLEIATWLQNEAAKLAKSASAREGMARTNRDATAADLRWAKVTAEKMAGRKLPGIKTTIKAARMDAEIQEKIAAKLNTEAQQLSGWAEYLRSLGKEQNHD